MVMKMSGRLSWNRRVESFFGENKPHAGLGRESLRSGIAFVAARGVNTVVQVGSTIVLARLLSPLDYGLVAMVFALIGFAPMLVELGTTDATIQSKRITEADATALFWLQASIGGTLTLLLAGSSGYIASFYGEPALRDIALVSSLTLIVAAVSTQHDALMRRAMRFRRIAVIDITANVVSSIIAIAMAVAGSAYWALVAKPLLTSALFAIGIWISCPWLPGRPRLTPQAKEAVRFGLGVTGFTMTDYLARSMDRLTLGYFYGAGQLGYFQNAFLLYDNLLNLFTQPLHHIGSSSLSKLRNAIDELKRSWATALSSLSFFSSLAFAVVAVTGQDFVVILLGQKWAPAGPILCIFAVRGIAHVVERTLGWLHVAAGRSDRWMRWGFLSAICQLVAVFVGISFGLVGVAVAHTIATFSLFVPALAYAGRPVGIGARDVVRAVGPQIASALVTVAIGFSVQHLFLVDLAPLPRFVVAASICVAVYLTMIVGVFKVVAPLRLALSLLRDFSATRFRGST
jgi:polysaccharide transporter, PST family